MNQPLSATHLHVDLDGAWPADALGLPTVSWRDWGPRLRFCAPGREMANFYSDVVATEIGREARFLVYGSGDFHHLSALWLRRLAGMEPALTLVSFDNHPDWDLRPPAWGCGSWINRALELSNVERASLWGMGNFECWGWHRLTGNHRDVRRGRLEVNAWADDRPASDQAKPFAMRQANWRDRFVSFANTLNGKRIYVTIDLDCLREGEAVTNWENGRFALGDVAWALHELRERGALIVAGDLCGAHSGPRTYARWTQRFASESDHPKQPEPDPAEAARVNLTAFRALWPELARAH